MSNRTVNGVTKTLIKTKEILADERNWLKNEAANWNYTAFCLLGAFTQAVRLSIGKTWNDKIGNEDAELIYTTDRVFRAANEIFRTSTFNDNPATTHKDIINALDKAIEVSLKCN